MIFDLSRFFLVGFGYGSLLVLPIVVAAIIFMYNLHLFR